MNELTNLQKLALVYFIEKRGEMPKNYLNSVHALISNGIIEYKDDPENKWNINKVITRKGCALYGMIKSA